jgi:hypothetical protein
MHEHYRGERVATELLRQHGAIRQNLPAPQGRGIGLFAAVAGCLLLASILILFLQVQGFLGHLEAKLAAETSGGNRLHALNQHMEALQGKFSALLADSVEVRLKALEQSVETGKVGADDLRIFESLKNDLQALQSYAQRSGATGLDYARLEHDRYRAVAASAPTPRGNELQSELLELKTLFYGCLAVLAVALLALYSYWSSQRRNLRRLELLATLPMLAGPPPDGSG